MAWLLSQCLNEALPIGGKFTLSKATRLISMEKLFGIQMSTLATGLLITLGILLFVIAIYAVKNRFLIKLSLRNLPRRRAQTALIVVGLMLSTTIVAASLSIGDTITGSIRNVVVDAIGDTDIVVRRPALGEFGDPTLTKAEIQEIADAVYLDERVDGIALIDGRTLPVINQRTRLTQARAVVVGYDPDGVNGHFRPESQGGPSVDSRLSPFLFLPTIDGETIDIALLADDEVLLNASIGNKLEAQPGDTLTVITPKGRNDLRIKAIMQNGGIAANDQRVFMKLSTYHTIMGSEPGTGSRVNISLDLEQYDLEAASEDIVEDLRLRFTDPAVASNIHSGMKEVAGLTAALEKYMEEESKNGGALNKQDREDFDALLAELALAEPTDKFRTLLADNRVTNNLFAAAAAADDQALRDALPAITIAFAQLERLAADEFKSDLLGIAEFVGNLFVTFFTFFGSFSVIVGLLLVFLIFVLLASERQQEMGIARAVGTKRGHLIQMFTFEGLAYAIGATAVGIIVGIGASRVLVGLMARAFGTDADDAFSLDFSVTFYSLLSAFCLGLVLTLLTVVYSAYRVSKLNIVVAIRNLPEEFVSSSVPSLQRRLLRVVFWIFGPLYALVRLINAIRHGEGILGAFIVMVLTWMIVGWIGGLIVAIFALFSPYFRQGWLLALMGLVATLFGLLSLENAALTFVGASATIFGLGLMAIWLMTMRGVRDTIANRISYTIVGLAILVLWATPSRFYEKLTGELSGDIEMFVLAGVWMVAAAVWVVMYNSDIVVRALQSTLGKFQVLRPILKPAVAYAVANRFRTGLTVSMFALVIFVMMAFSILNSSFNTLISAPELITGGFDIRAEINPELPIEDIESAIRESAELDIADFTLITGMSDEFTGARQTDSSESRFLDLSVRGAEADYFNATQLRIQAADPAYLPSGVSLDDQNAVSSGIWQALAENPSLAVITEEHVPGAGFGGGPQTFDDPLQLEDATIEADGSFVSKKIEIVMPDASDLSSSVERTVIAVADSNADSLENSGDGGPAAGFIGIYTRHDIFDELMPEQPPYTIYKMKLTSGADAARVAGSLETLFLDHSMLAIDTVDEVEVAISQNEQFSLLFQGFMGLGLIVGVASLGVLSMRAVNERRVQIAIMRAIGYRARMIRAGFIMESIFITLIGIGLGVGLGALISWSFLDDIRDQAQGLEFTVPWASVSVILVVTIIAALITTYLPARQASQIYPAEALKYE